MLRYFLRKIHEQLDEITEFKVLKEAERIDSIKKKLAVGSEIESWLDNVPAIDVNERKIILESLLQKEVCFFLMFVILKNPLFLWILIVM
ncbi:hypothetical protein AU254_03210 [Yersinia pestis]|nr:hypothetical protein AU254_03210 [Yersinia pestis]